MRSKIPLIFLGLYHILYFQSFSSIIIEGQIHNFDRENIQLNIIFGTYYLEFDAEISIEVSEQGIFSQEVAVDDLRFAVLQLGGEEIGLLLEPSMDKISFEWDYKTPNDVVFKGKYANLLGFVNVWTQKNYYFEYESLATEIKADLDKLYEFCDQERSQMLEELESIDAELIPETWDLLRVEIDHYYLALKIHGGIEMGYLDQEGELSIGKAQNDQHFSTLDCNHKYDYLPSYNYTIEMYERHRDRVLNAKFSQGDTVSYLSTFEARSISEISESLGGDNYNRPKYLLIKDWDCSPGVIKSLANRIVRSQKSGDFENLSWLYERFLELSPPEELKEKLAPIMDKFSQLESTIHGEREGINFYPKKAFETGILSIIQQEKYRGKVILIDIWGTWCAPCREQFPHLLELKKELAEEDIAYIYLSKEVLENPEPHWRETVNFFNLKGDHYLVTKEQLYQFKQDINNLFPGNYPTYLIADRNGEIAISEAAYPSDGDKLFQQITSVLKDE